MEWIEVRRKSLDDAVELALDRLGVVADELEYEVIDEPRAGLFGRLGRGDARIRARVKPLSREKPADRRRRRRGGEHRPAKRAAAAASHAPRRRVGPPQRGPVRAGSVRAARRTEDRRRRRRRPRSGGGRRRAAPMRARRECRDSEAEANDVDSDSGALDRRTGGRGGAASPTSWCGRSGSTATVEAEVVDDDIELRIDGEGSSLGVLVGPKGATLQALEELVRAVVQHAAGGQSARLHVDVAGYRERRREALAAFARAGRRRGAGAGSERALEPMSPPDRKVVHDTVAELDGVATSSVGEEPRRRVVIKPA